MGLHRKHEVTPAGGVPIPFQPKAGKNKSSCREAAGALIQAEWEKQSEDEWIRRHNQELDASFAVGGEITLYSALNFYGEGSIPETDPFRQLPTAGEVAATYPTGVPGSPERPAYNNVPGTPGWTPSTGLDEVEKHKIDKVKDKVNGQVRTKVIEGRNPKAELLKRKKNLRFEEGAGPHQVDEMVKDLIDGTELTDDGVDDVEVTVPHWDFNEYMLMEAIDICAKLAGANYNVDEEGDFNFFLPDSRPHPFPATTDPAGSSSAVTGRDVRTVAIQKGSVERIVDSSDMVNRAQLMNAGDLSEEYVEEFKGDGIQHEFHTTYEPVFCTVTVEREVADLPPLQSLNLYQDWGDRSLLTDSYPGAPYDSPQCGAPGVIADPICYINVKEKAFRLADAVTGADVPLAANNTLTITYKHLDPVYSVIEDPASIDEWGLVEKTYVFPDRQRIEEARMLVEAEVNDYSQPLTMLQCNVFDDVYRVGDSVRFVIPELGIDEYMAVFEVERTWDVTLRGTDQDPGWSVKIRAGSKLPIKLSDILRGMHRRIAALERVYNMTDLNASTGFLVPIQYDVLMKEDLAVSDFFSFAFFSSRIDEGRIDRSRIA